MAINQKLGLDDGNQQLDEDDISNMGRDTNKIVFIGQ